MFPHSQCTRVDSEPSCDFGTLEPVNVKHPQKIPVLLPHRLQRPTDFLSPHFIDQGDEWIILIAARRAQPSTESQQRACLAPHGAAVMQTDVARGLKYECR